MAKVTQKKAPDWAGATPLFRLSAAQKSSWGRSRPLHRKRDRVLFACPSGAVTQDKRNYFSVGDILISPRTEQASRGRMSLFSEAEMADRTNQNLTHYTLRRPDLGSVDADFLYCADAASSFLRALRNGRGEERFTPVLQGALHRSLHRSAACKARQ